MEMTLCRILFWDKFYHCLDIIDIDAYLRVREFLRTSLCALIDQVQERRLQAPPTLIAHFYMSMHLLIKVKLLATWSHISSTLKKEIVFFPHVDFPVRRRQTVRIVVLISPLGSRFCINQYEISCDIGLVNGINIQQSVFRHVFLGGGKCFRGHVSTLEIFE